MKITLAQAVPLRGIISRHIQELLQERNNVATVETKQSETYEKPSRSIDEVADELNVARKDFRQLDVSMAKANLEGELEWDGSVLSITEAIELAKQLRGEVAQLKNFGRRKKQERSTNWRTEEVTIVHALYDPEEYRKKALKMERQVNRLSQEIEAKNHKVEFDFEAATRYLEY